MHFDASPKIVSELKRSLGTDTRVLRWTTLKIGEKLDDVVGRRERTTRLTQTRFAASNSQTDYLEKKYA
jgi:ribosomal protein S6